MEVHLDAMEVMNFRNNYELCKRLEEKGLDTSRPFIHLVASHDHEYIYRGAALPDRTTGLVRTCIGVIPVKQEWEVV